jgi:hypothetical protein
MSKEIDRRAALTAFAGAALAAPAAAIRPTLAVVPSETPELLALGEEVERKLEAFYRKRLGVNGQVFPIGREHEKIARGPFGSLRGPKSARQARAQTRPGGRSC